MDSTLIRLCLVSSKFGFGPDGSSFLGSIFFACSTTDFSILKSIFGIAGTSCFGESSTFGGGGVENCRSDQAEGR